MATVIKERLDSQMSKEGVDIASLNYATREGMYTSLINGPVSLNDINDAAELLGCNPSYLLGKDISDKVGVKHQSSTVCILGDRIRKGIKQLCWTAITFSQYTGIPAGSITAYWGKDKNYTTLETAETIAFGLNCSIDYLSGKTDDVKRYDRYHISNKYLKNICMNKVDPKALKDWMHYQSISYNALAEMIKLPFYLVKKALVTGEMPEKCANNVQKLMDDFMQEKHAKSISSKSVYTARSKASPVSEQKKTEKLSAKEKSSRMEPEERVMAAKEYVDKIATPLTRNYFESKQQEKLDKEARKDQADRIQDMVKQRKDITIAMSTPSNGLISTGQLLSLAMVTEKHPDLLNLFSEITELDEEDYNNLFTQIRWMVEVLKRNK